MRKAVSLFLVMLAMVIVSYLFFNRQDVVLEGGHQTDWSATILVNRLPVTESASIEWWVKNQQRIIQKYQFRANNPKGTLDYYLFAFGAGYVAEDDKDRLCFTDMPPPKNCIDKDLLMSVSTTGDGSTEFRFDDAVYTRDKMGNIAKVK